jgi:hypothetical protein
MVNMINMSFGDLIKPSTNSKLTRVVC